MGFVSGLRKWVRICWLKLPNKVVNKVACGLEELTVQEAPVARRQADIALGAGGVSRRYAVFPAGGVMMGGVGGGVTLSKASAGVVVIPANNVRASAAMQALITLSG